MGTLSTNTQALRETLDTLAGLEDAVESAATLIGDAITGGDTLLACGNGGSAMDAAHLTTEFVCRFVENRRGYPAICLSTAAGDITAIGNDFGFEHVFSRQVQAFGTAGDVLLAISTSGKSANVTNALSTASELGLSTIALLGRDGGDAAGLADVELLVPGDSTARIQEAHKLILHTICEIVDKRLMTLEK